MAWEEYITVDPQVLAGKPIIRGTRLSVELIVGFLAQGWTEADLLRSYPGLTREQILACLGYAQERLSSERIYPLTV